MTIPAPSTPFSAPYASRKRSSLDSTSGKCSIIHRIPNIATPDMRPFPNPFSRILSTQSQAFALNKGEHFSLTMALENHASDFRGKIETILHHHPQVLIFTSPTVLGLAGFAGSCNFLSHRLAGHKVQGLRPKHQECPLVQSIATQQSGHL